jgi:hypothetical protein
MFYTKELFETKTTKRAIEKGTVSTILEWRNLGAKNRGSAMALCGPAVEEHIKTLLPLLRPKSELLFAEWSKEVAEKNDIAGSVKAFGDKRIVYHFGNIWDVMRKQYIYKKGWKGKHVFFDLDFCRTADTLIAQGLQQELKRLAVSKLPRKNGFWLSITACQRGDKSSEWWELYHKTGQIFLRADWAIKSGTRILPYTEGRTGANMVNMLFHFMWDYNKARKRAKNALSKSSKS